MNDTRDNESILRRLPGLAAAVMLVSIVVLRCVVVFTPQLYWVIDPRLEDPSIPSVEFGPLGAAVTNWLLILSLALAVLDRQLRGGRAQWMLIGLWVIGSGFALHQGRLDFESMRIGFDWVGTLAAGLAAVHLGQDRRLRRFMIAAAIALLIPLCVQAAYQFTIEHDMTVRDYEKNRTQFLAERGWTEGSTEHQKFEQRLYQREATGRFGFSNVFGSVVMALTLAAIGAAVGLMQDRQGFGRPHAMVAIVALAGLATLGMTFSKGATLAMIIAVVATGAACWIAWRFKLGAKWWRLAAVGVVAIGIGAVAVRGMIGEPPTAEGERSLLFRWHYWQAAQRIWTEHPVAGVGPGRFQQAYLIHKNPLNPEEVTDPHNIFAAYISTLGVGGIAWSAVLLALLLGAAKLACAANDDKTDTNDWRTRWGLASAAGLIAFITQLGVEQPRYAGDGVLLWLLASAAWIMLCGWLSGRRELDGRYASLGLVAACFGLMLHAQIEMSLTNAMSGPVLAMLLGVAAAGVSPTKPQGKWIRWGTLIVLIVAFLGALGRMFTPIVIHEHKLLTAVREARQTPQPPTLLQELLPSIRTGAATGVPDARVAIWEAQLWLEQNRLQDALLALSLAVKSGSRLAELYNYKVLLHHRRYEMTNDARFLGSAASLALTTLEYDPYGIANHLRAADLAWEAGRREQAVELYRKTLRLSEQAYLDPLKQLTDEQVQRIEARIAEAQR